MRVQGRADGASCLSPWSTIGTRETPWAALHFHSCPALTPATDSQPRTTEGAKHWKASRERSAGVGGVAVCRNFPPCLLKIPPPGTTAPIELSVVSHHKGALLPCYSCSLPETLSCRRGGASCPMLPVHTSSSTSVLGWQGEETSWGVRDLRPPSRARPCRDAPEGGPQEKEKGANQWSAQRHIHTGPRRCHRQDCPQQRAKGATEQGPG